MSQDTDKLVEALEFYLEDVKSVGPDQDTDFIEEALSLARQLIEERDEWVEACRQEQQRHASTLEENERLKDMHDSAVAKVMENANEIDNLRIRLSDFRTRLTELQDFHAKKMDEMHVRLSEAEVARTRNAAEDLEDDLKRAEEVVEAAKAAVEKHLFGICDQTHYPEAYAEGCIYPQRLRDAIRRYEEGK